MNEDDLVGKYYCYNHEMKRTVIYEGFVGTNGPAVKVDGRTLHVVEAVALKI